MSKIKNVFCQNTEKHLFLIKKKKKKVATVFFTVKF